MIEIQVHPSDIRRRVRYFFFDRRVVIFAIIGGVIVLAFVLLSMTAAPAVIRRVYKDAYVRSLRQQHAVQTEKLREHVAQMTVLEKVLDEHRIRVEKLVAVYGLDRSGMGKGGFAPTRSAADASIQLADAQHREQQLRSSIELLQRQLDMLSDYERSNAELIRHIPSILPLPADQFVLTSSFGSRISPFTRRADFHKGLDLAAATNTPIYATADGVVTFAGRVPLSQSVAWWRFGNVVVINHANRFITIYGHCETVNARAGQAVKQGEQVAAVGSTGWSTNSHLHYEVRTDFKSTGNYVPVDPRIYILNYQWNNEEKILSKLRDPGEFRDFDPLPSAFIGRRRV